MVYTMACAVSLPRTVRKQKIRMFDVFWISKASGYNLFGEFLPLFGEDGPIMIHIFQRGWNPQLRDCFLSSLTYASILEMGSPKLGAWIEEKIASIKEGHRHVESGGKPPFLLELMARKSCLCQEFQTFFQLVYSIQIIENLYYIYTVYVYNLCISFQHHFATLTSPCDFLILPAR